MKPSIGLVIVNYFSSEAVLTQLSVLRQLDAVTMDSIVIVDNSCYESQWQQLQAAASVGVGLFRAPTNLGFGAAVNLGAQQLPSTDFICVINPDVVITPQAMADLVDHAVANSEQGIWGGLVVNEAGVSDNRSAWRQPTILRALGWSLLLHRCWPHPKLTESYRLSASEAAYPVDAVSGCLLLLSRPAWQAVKGFDQRFFLYSEEIDLCTRARALGFQPTVVTAVKVVHPQHQGDKRFERVEALYHARALYAHKHFSPLKAMCYRQVLALGVLLRALSAKGSNRQVWFKVMAVLLSDRTRSGANCEQ